MGKNTTKQEWRESAKRMLTILSYDIVRRVSTREVRIIIADFPPNDKKGIGSCTVPAYKKEQEYQFYMEEIKGRTKIFVCQKEMSKNADKYIILSENIPLNQLDDDTQCLYKDMITNFLMANIVWK